MLEIGEREVHGHQTTPSTLKTEVWSSSPISTLATALPTADWRGQLPRSRTSTEVEDVDRLSRRRTQLLPSIARYF